MVTVRLQADNKTRAELVKLCRRAFRLERFLPSSVFGLVDLFIEAILSCFIDWYRICVYVGYVLTQHWAEVT